MEVLGGGGGSMPGASSTSLFCSVYEMRANSKWFRRIKIQRNTQELTRSPFFSANASKNDCMLAGDQRVGIF